MPTALDDIEAAAGALNNLTAQEAVAKAAIDAAVAAALSATVAPSKAVYLDAVAGLDTNDGSTPQRAVASLNRAAALINAGQLGLITMLSDVVLTAPLAPGRPFFLSSQLNPDGTVAGTKRTLTIAPSAVNMNPGPVNLAINFGIAGPLTFYNIKISIGAITGANGVIGALGDVHFRYVDFSFDPGQTSPLMFVPGCSYTWFASCTLPASYAGRLFAGVPAGANPNSPTLRTNITSA